MRLKIKIVLFAVLALLALTAFAVWLGPTSIEIRTDCGDIRYLYLGIPVIYERQQEPARSDLISISSTSSRIEARWIKVVPRMTSNSFASEYQSHYFGAGKWATVDKNVARLLQEELSDQITKANGSRPAVFPGIHLLVWGESNPSLSSDALSEAEVQVYCRERGYRRSEWIESTGDFHGLNDPTVGRK